MAQEELQKVLEKRVQPYPQIEIEKAILDTNFLYRLVTSSIRSGNFEGAADIAHSMSLLWKHLVIMTDTTLS